MILPENCRLSHDPKTLLREVDAAIRIKDMEKLHRCRDQVELKWWEAGIVLLLFISGLGFTVTIYKLIPEGNGVLFWFVFIWFALFTLSLVAAVEFLLVKIHALRQLYEIHARMLERMDRELAGLSGSGREKESERQQ